MYKVSFADLDQGSEMIFLSWLLDIDPCSKREQALFSEAAEAVVKIGLSLKSNYHRQI